MKLGELFFELGFRADTMKLKDFGKAVSELNMSSILTAGSFGAVYEGATKLVDVANHMALGLNHFSNETGQSTQDLQKWGLVAEEAGVSTGTVVSGVKSLQDQIFKMKITGEGSNVWSMLGIDPTKDKNNFETLYKLGVQLSKLDVSARRFFLGQLGLGDEWLNILPKIVSHYGDLSSVITMSTADQQKMIQYQKISADLTHDWSVTLADLGVTIMPVLGSLKEIADSIDKNVLRSKAWKWYIDGVANTLEIIAHPVKSMQALAGSNGKFSDSIIHPLFRFPWQHFNLDGTYATGNLNAADSVGPNLQPKSMGGASGDRKPNIVVKNTVHTSDPSTTIDTTTDHGTLSNTVRNIVNQRSAGTT